MGCGTTRVGGCLGARSGGGLALAASAAPDRRQTIDPAARRLYITHQGDGAIVIVDLAHRRITGRIGGLANVHGVLVVPALHRLFANATGLHQLVTIDTDTIRIVRRAPAGIVPDGIAYHPIDRQVFVSDERPAGATSPGPRGASGGRRCSPRTLGNGTPFS
jgi:hypothetical protein